MHSPMPGASRTTLRGPLLMVSATACFTVMVTLVKLARAWDLGTLELMGWRALVAVPILFVGSRAWRIRRPALMALRCIFGFCAMFCFFFATDGLGIGELTLLTKLQPVMVAVFAPFALGSAERPSPGTWNALALGLLGTLAIAWPSLGASDVRAWSVLGGLGAATCSTLAHTTLRALKRESAAAIVFWFQVSAGLAVIAGMALTSTPTHVPAPHHLPALVGIGGFALAGQLLMTRAYATDTAPRVAAAGFVGPLMGFAVDAAVFGRAPGPSALLGAAFILAAGVVLVRDARAA